MTNKFTFLLYMDPGCPYCAKVLGELDNLKLNIPMVNIMEDMDAFNHLYKVNFLNLQSFQVNYFF